MSYHLYGALTTVAFVAAASFPAEVIGEMTVRDYERLRSSDLLQDRARVESYVEGLINGLLWASTKSERELGTELMCNTDQLTNHDKVYSILDAEIKRKGITPDAKTRLPLGLIAVE